MGILIRVILKLEIIFSRIRFTVERRIIQQSSNSPIIVLIGSENVNLSKLLPEIPLILEVGAFNGMDTLRFSNRYPKGSIIAFEPDRRNFVIASNRCRTRGNVRIFPFALGAKNGIGTFHESDGYSRASGSILRPSEIKSAFPEISFSTDVEVITPIIALDDVIGLLFPDWSVTVDLLWMDAQGAELLILEGAIETLDRVNLIFCEVSSFKLYENGAVFSEIDEFLTRQGFLLVASDISEDSGHRQSGNALYMRR